MKKIKLFALAALLLGSTSAFAAYQQDYTYQGLVYELDIDGTTYTATVKSISDDETYTVKTAWEIPASFKALATSGANIDCADKTFTVVGIGEDAFANNSNIKTITFAKAENIVEIGEGAFAKTSMTSLDLSGTKIEILYELFEPVNAKVTEIKLPATLAYIAPNAFEGLSVLTSIDFSKCEADFGIGKEAFKNTMALTTIEFPEVAINVEELAFSGSYLTEVTFNGDVTTEAGSFTSPKLVTINFNADLTAASDIAAGVFEPAAGQKLTVNYKPTATAAAPGDVFEKDAFGVEAAAQWVTFTTTQAFGEACTDNLGWKNATPFVYGVKLVYTVPTPDPTTIKVYSGTGSYYYGTWFSTEKDIKIAKKQDNAGNVMVYGAYVDNAADGTAILMDQLMLIGGFYYIPAGTPVIVKASKNADVVYTEDNTEDSTKDDADGADVNQILTNGLAEVFAKDIKDASAPGVVYFLAPIEEYGFLWSKFKDNTVVAPFGFYIVATPAAPDRVKVIWLDGSEEDQVTAIQTVKKANAEKGAIYNLAGQKVNAAYKGVVIKDGKKYIQK